MSVIRLGSTSKYADGWEQIFGGATGARRGKAVAKKGVKRPAKKAARGKPAATKGSRKQAKSQRRARGRI